MKVDGVSYRQADTCGDAIQACAQAGICIEYRMGAVLLEVDIHPKLKEYIPLAEFMSKCYGDNVEVVLHDISDLDHSAVAIYNSHVSGRETGAPFTYFGLKIIREELYKKQDYVVDKRNILSNGKVLRASTYFITDDDGSLIGTLCVNMDVSHFVELSHMFDRMAFGAGGEKELPEPLPEPASSPKETFPTTVDDLIDGTLSEFVGDAGSADIMTPEQKIEFVGRLSDKGIFMYKGTVKKVSVALGVSEPSVYRYLNMANSNQGRHG